MGIPTATIVTDEFVILANAEARTRGFADFPLVKVPHPVGSISLASLRCLAVASIDRIIERLTSKDAGLGDLSPKQDGQDIELAPTVQVSATASHMFEYFSQQGWTDGLPVIAPTANLVQEMVDTVGLRKDDLIGVIPPVNGKATVEKIAANAVMAGCLPAYFPVVMAAIEAMLQPTFNLNGIQTTTSNVTPLLIVNGPCRQALNLNFSGNVLGQGWRANATIGRAIRLILSNIGGAAPGVLDKATLGQPAKYTFCIAENEEENPWEPLHVESGLGRGVNAVSVCGCTGIHSIVDMASKTPKGIITTTAAAMAAGGSSNWFHSCEALIIMCPEHAAIFSAGGYSKDDIRQELFQKARLPHEKFSEENLELIAKRRPRWFSPGEASEIPIVDKPEAIWIIVAGGKGPKSAFIPSWVEVKLTTTPLKNQTASVCGCQY